MADILPKTIILKAANGAATNVYASYMYESDKGAGLVSCKAENVFKPLAKIEVEPAKIDPKFVHLRFSYTNKYWARRGPGTSDYWILATSNQPEEDRSKPSCTLFEPTIKIDGLLYLTHVQSGGALQVCSTDPNRGVYATTGVTGTGFGLIDWDTLVRIPKHVAFKGDNGKYLNAYSTQDGYPHQQFSSDDGNDEVSSLEVESYPDGHVGIECDYFGKAWRCNIEEWILVNTKDDTPMRENMFWPVKVAGNTIALRSVENNKFVRRVNCSVERFRDCLSNSAITINPSTKIVVEELVLERRLYNVRYRMEDTRIYDERLFVAGIGAAANESDTESTMSIRIEYEKKRSYCYSRSFSLSTGVPTTILAGIPRIVEGQIEVSAETTTQLEWETTTEETKTAVATYTVKVPPRSRIVVEFVATSGRCRVPFSYTQKDKSSKDGQFVTSQHSDGMFTGVNYYNFHFEQHAVQPLRKIDLP